MRASRMVLEKQGDGRCGRYPLFLLMKEADACSLITDPLVFSHTSRSPLFHQNPPPGALLGDLQRGPEGLILNCVCMRVCVCVCVCAHVCARKYHPTSARFPNMIPRRVACPNSLA